MTKTVAEIIVDTIMAAGVTRVYGVVGDSLNGITDVIRAREGIEWIHVRNEEAGAFAAGAEAHLTNSLAVCAGSCGPGNTHLFNGLYDCHRSRVPVLALAAQIPSIEIGTGYFQETHPETTFKECSAYCELLSQPSQAVRMTEAAIQTALSQRGVAVLVVPGDVTHLDVPDVPAPRLPILRNKATLVPATEDLRAAADLLNTCEKITIMAGAGCAEAHAELLQVAEALGAPIVHALRGKEYVEPNNPYDVGMSGLLGFTSGYHALMDADSVLLLGTDFPYTQFLPQEARNVQVDVRGEHIGRRVRVEVGLVGDVAATIRALLPLLNHKQDRTHLEKALDNYQEARKDLDELAIGEPGDTSMHPQYVTRLLNEQAAEDAIFTCDVGTPTIWAARYVRFNGQRRLIGSFNHGSMANAMPQAIGAQLTHPGRQVIAMAGDGGLAMLLGELLTIRQLKLPVKIVVYNNASLGFVELEMKANGILEYGTALDNPNFAALAEAAGLHGIRVTDPAEMPAAVAEMLAHPGPVLLDAVVKRTELSMPPTIDASQVKGFSIYALKALMSGRGGELVDMAKTNLFR
ncbi:ubiquinone-dependent pyruvate dehydrogenase [Hymenobacter sp. BT186]|uniref:Pyruvate dehydrogenase [ubiquinone] n=1 Tax=Hymenobacter telluris TaxID=2816474 RepID=A0A939EY02_9BACT|nr:ubiquinone-dependent pyruvate dehydrogenase [Hymenobacter telluris]MBO0359284.1 ubiquinone-dependent pyruvate dehydrogenase [Hymenobacter telluris]MBW3375310.1 ubiquinone-dependent pyruvate dehydrogenase [Hymenobacter norwichensis]